MACLKDSSGAIITNRVTKVIPGYKTQKVVQQLLSGSHHVQTIGKGARIANITLFASEAGKESIDTAESTGANVQVEAGTKFYTGCIEAAPSWNEHMKDLYSVTIVILVMEEGAVS